MELHDSKGIGDSSVSIVTRLWAVWLGVESRRGKRPYGFQNVQTCPGTHSAP